MAKLGRRLQASEAPAIADATHQQGVSPAAKGAGSRIEGDIQGQTVQNLRMFAANGVEHFATELLVDDEVPQVPYSKVAKTA
jgi:hypothetical protein